MENNLINILMETDPKKLERNTKTDIEITRLSEIFGTPFLVTVKALPGDRYTELASGTLMGDDGKVADMGLVKHVWFPPWGDVSDDLCLLYRIFRQNAIPVAAAGKKCYNKVTNFLRGKDECHEAEFFRR